VFGVCTFIHVRIHPVTFPSVCNVIGTLSRHWGHWDKAAIVLDLMGAYSPNNHTNKYWKHNFNKFSEYNDKRNLSYWETGVRAAKSPLSILYLP
jgi:hypothetical protein